MIDFLTGFIGVLAVAGCLVIIGSVFVYLYAWFGYEACVVFFFAMVCGLLNFLYERFDT